MPEPMSLDGILSGEEKPEPKEAPVVKTEPKEPAGTVNEPVERPQSRRKAWEDKEQAAQGRVRDPVTGQFAPKQEAKPEAAPEAAKPAAEPAKAESAKPVAAAPAPQQEFTEKEKAFLRAAQEERGKRQEAERKLAEALAGKQQEPAKGFWDDPEGFIKKQKDETAQAVTSVRLQTAELIARQRHTDFDEKVQVFSQVVAQTPGLAQQWLASPDPAEFAYQTGKNHMDLQQAGNLDALREKITKETETRVRAEVEKEMKEKAEALEKERAALPGSLSDARNTGAGSRPVWGGPRSLDEVLKPS